MDSIIFDLDGTLWDSTRQISIVWGEILKNYNTSKKQVTVEELCETMSMSAKDMINKYFPELDEEMTQKLIDDSRINKISYLSINGARLYDKLEATLEKLSKKYKLYIVSNCYDGYIEAFIKSHNMSKYFQDTECSGRTKLSKAENIKLIMDRNNLQASIYVGDMQGDCNAAKAANIPFVYAKYGFGKNVEGYDYSIEKFEDLLNIVK